VIVPGEGPVPCNFMFVGEYPGIEEARTGRPFVGKSGQEMRRYLNGYNLPYADDIYLTNLRKRPVEKGEDYDLSDEEEAEIWREIALVRPKVIVTLGAHVTKYFVGPEATLEATYGIPHLSGFELRGEGGKGTTPYDMTGVAIFPSYNPAAMLHSPAMQAWFAKGMRLLEAYLKGKLPPAPIDLHKGTYIDISSDGAWSVVGETIEQFSMLGTDTEGWAWNAWGASIAGEAYVGYVAKNGTAGWKRLRDHIRSAKPQIELHNSLHDLSVMRAMDPPLDLDLDEIPFGDTQVRAYLLGLEPQGLKPLAKRHAGMDQDDYLDIVAVPNARIAEQWLTELAERLPAREDRPREGEKTAQEEIGPAVSPERRGHLRGRGTHQRTGTERRGQGTRSRARPDRKDGGEERTRHTAQTLVRVPLPRNPRGRTLLPRPVARRPARRDVG
jgi:uracil-DNA glycosylase family 4